MKRVLGVLSSVVIAVLSLGATPALAADEGVQVFQKTCVQCHTKDQRPLEDKRLTREEWKEAVKKMAEIGVELPTGKDLAALYEYLVRTYGR